MTEYKPGDWVLIRVSVESSGVDIVGETYVGVPNSRGGIAGTWVSNDAIVGPAEPPVPPEPGPDHIVIDKDGDTWTYFDDGLWYTVGGKSRLPWDLLSNYGPFRVFREVP